MSFVQVIHDSISFPLYIQKRSGVWFSAEMRKIIETGDWLTDQHMSLAQEILKGQFSHIDGWQSTLLVQIDDSFLLKAKLFKYILFLTHIG